MTTYVIRNGQLIDRNEAPPLVQIFGLGPAVISDTMSETRHMANGRYYTSKTEFRKATKAAGCVELGNDSSLLKPRKPVPLDRRKRRDDIKRTIHELKNRGPK